LYWITEQMSFRWSAADPELLRLAAAMDEIERSHGLSEEESFTLRDGPAEWIALSHEWDRRLDVIWADEFRRVGEPELARLMRSGALHDDPRVYDGRHRCALEGQRTSSDPSIPNKRTGDMVMALIDALPHPAPAGSGVAWALTLMQILG
jgi:hypothetical protein